MKSIKAQPYLLQAKIQHYAWGTKNEKAFIPHFLNIPVEKDKPYAELWMGTHPNAPTDVLIEGNPVPLSDMIRMFPEEILGEKVFSRFKGLPFLFKVLSAAQALSIQAHPDKQQAQILHTRDPQHYPDDNHKPEIAIALSELTALAGFKSYDQLIDTLENYPEIASFIGNEIVAEMKEKAGLTEEEQKPVLKKMYHNMMTKSLAHKELLSETIGDMEIRLSSKNILTAVEEEFFNLRQSYPGADSGLFSLFLLNRIQLSAGQGLFLKAGLPHAYLKGTIVECMANSDNVVRAGLTAKFQDVDTLVDILTYETQPVEIQEGQYKNGEIIYNAPVPEFQISRIDLNNNSFKQKTSAVQILLIVAGIVRIQWLANSQTFSQGQSLIIPAILSSYTIISNKTATIFKVTVP